MNVRHITSLTVLVLFLMLASPVLAGTGTITIYGTNATNADTNATAAGTDNNIQVTAWGVGDVAHTFRINVVNASDTLTFIIGNFTPGRIIEIKVNGTAYNGFQATDDGELRFTRTQATSNQTYTLTTALTESGRNATWGFFYDLHMLNGTVENVNVVSTKYPLPNASAPPSSANRSSSNEYTGTTWMRGNVSVGSANNTATTGYYNNFNYVIFDSLGALPATDYTVCIQAVDGRFRYNAAATCTVSDIYKKVNISNVYANLTSKLMQLQLIRYQDSNDPAKRWRYGFSAQAVAKISTELVGTDYIGLGKPTGVVIDSADGYEKMQYTDGKLANITSVNYEIIAALDAKVIQEQQNQIDYLYTRLNIAKP